MLFLRRIADIGTNVVLLWRVGMLLGVTSEVVRGPLHDNTLNSSTIDQHML